MNTDPLLILLGLLGAYFLPAIIAKSREHYNFAAISVLNLVLGWTVLGWLIALVWSFTCPTRER